MSSFSKLKLRFLGSRRKVTSISTQEATPYASVADFCLVFMANMDGLYLLSFLLTGEHSLAEKCFVNGLDESQEGNPVFKEWALSWARRTIIQKAIQMIRPEIRGDRRSSSTSGGGERNSTTQPSEIANILALPQFERFVFVMSVLERYSFQECSLLLNCTRNDVISARSWAQRQIARAADLSRKIVSIDSDEQAFPQSQGSLPQTETSRGVGSELRGKVSLYDDNDRHDHTFVTNVRIENKERKRL